MGRPQKETADYFPHVTAHKKTMFILEGRWGNDGYAFWFKMLECLGRAPGHYYDCQRSDDWEYLFTYARVSEETANAIMEKLACLGAVDAELWHEHRVIWSDNFVSGLLPLYKNRKQEPPKKPSFCEGKLQYDDISTSRNIDTDEFLTTETDKEEKSREEYSIENNPSDYSSSPPQKSEGKKTDIGGDKIPYDDIVTEYHARCPDLPKVIKLTDARRKAIRGRWDKNSGIFQFCSVFDRVAKSDFLHGKIRSPDHPNFMADFDFILKPEKWVKIQEGKYDNDRFRSGRDPGPEEGAAHTGAVPKSFWRK